METRVLGGGAGGGHACLGNPLAWLFTWAAPPPPFPGTEATLQISIAAVRYSLRAGSLDGFQCLYEASPWQRWKRRERVRWHWFLHPGAHADASTRRADQWETFCLGPRIWGEKEFRHAGTPPPPSGAVTNAVLCSTCFFFYFWVFLPVKAARVGCGSNSVEAVLTSSVVMLRGVSPHPQHPSLHRQSDGKPRVRSAGLPSAATTAADGNERPRRPDLVVSLASFAR